MTSAMAIHMEDAKAETGATRISLKNAMQLSQAQKLSRKVTKESKSAHMQSVGTRVFRMLEEAVEFKMYIERYEFEAACIEAATTDFLDTVVPLLSVPLPRVWNEVEGGLAEPSRTTETHGHPSVAGGEYDAVAIKGAVSRFAKASALDIRKPLNRWLDALHAIREQVMELERLRHHMEKRAKKVDAGEQAVEAGHLRRVGTRSGAARGKDGSAGIGKLFASCMHPSGGVVREERLGSLQHGQVEEGLVMEEDQRQEDRTIWLKDKQRKLDVVLQGFEEKEQQLYEVLSGLCKDAPWLKSYMGGEMMLLKELMQEAAYWLGPTKQSLPVFPISSDRDKAEGEISDNLDIISGMPPFLDRHERKAALGKGYWEEHVYALHPARTTQRAAAAEPLGMSGVASEGRTHGVETAATAAAAPVAPTTEPASVVVTVAKTK